MKVDFRNSFLNAIKKVRDKRVKDAVVRAILSVEKADSVDDIPNLKKIKGFKNANYFRIRIGDYRIGIAIEHDLVIFVALDQRKDIYKYFP